MKRAVLVVMVLILVLGIATLVLTQQKTKRGTTQPAAAPASIDTTARLESKNTPKSAQRLRLTKNKIIALQKALARSGYYKSTIDGIWGPMTKHSLQLYQQDYFLTVTGEPNAETLKSLGVSYGAAYGAAKTSPTQSKVGGKGLK
jgi:peptidoglycan hydrolase-like protein with peptidoglycan-binding domain